MLVLALAFYFVLIGYRGIYLLGQDRWVLKVLGRGGAGAAADRLWVVVAELRFGLASQRLANGCARRASRELPELPRLPSGRLGPRGRRRVVRPAAGRWWRPAPEDWRGWFRLAQAYDLAGDRARAGGAAHRHRAGHRTGAAGLSATDRGRQACS